MMFSQIKQKNSCGARVNVVRDERVSLEKWSSTWGIKERTVV